ALHSASCRGGVPTMAIDEGAQFSIKPEDAPIKRKRVKASDRPEYPPVTGLRASRYGIADKLNGHFTRARNDAEYGLAWTEYRAVAMHARADDNTKMARKRAKVTKQEPTVRVRASELKTCARATAMRLMGFNG